MLKSGAHIIMAMMMRHLKRWTHMILPTPWAVTRGASLKSPTKWIGRIDIPVNNAGGSDTALSGWFATVDPSMLIDDLIEHGVHTFPVTHIAGCERRVAALRADIRSDRFARAVDRRERRLTPRR